MIAKIEYLTKKQVVKILTTIRSRLCIELEKTNKNFLGNFSTFTFPTKNKETVIASVGHSYHIVNNSKLRYDLIIMTID